MRTKGRTTSEERFDYGVLAVGVAAVSTAALFIREADAPAMVIAAYRLVLASAPLLAWSGLRGVAATHEPATVSPTVEQSSRQRWLLVALTVASGVFLALHFGFWVASVKQTSVVTSVVLVTSQPLLVAVAARPLLGERTTRDTWIGIAIAIAGAAAMVADDAGKGSSTLMGDVYAMLGAVFAAAYLLTGRSLRLAGVGWLPYVTRVYSIAAVVLVIAAVVAGEGFTGYSTRTFGFFVLLALVPQLIGHTALNRSLGHMPAASVTIAVLGEPVGATLLAAVFLSETPTALQMLGALLVLAGVYAGLRGTRGVSEDMEASA